MLTWTNPSHWSRPAACATALQPSSFGRSGIRSKLLCVVGEKLHNPLAKVRNNLSSFDHRARSSNFEDVETSERRIRMNAHNKHWQWTPRQTIHSNLARWKNNQRTNRFRSAWQAYGKGKRGVDRRIGSLRPSVSSVGRQDWRGSRRTNDWTAQSEESCRKKNVFYWGILEKTRALRIRKDMKRFSDTMCVTNVGIVCADRQRSNIIQVWNSLRLSWAERMHVEFGIGSERMSARNSRRENHWPVFGARLSWQATMNDVFGLVPRTPPIGALQGGSFEEKYIC